MKILRPSKETGARASLGEGQGLGGEPEDEG